MTFDPRISEWDNPAVWRTVIRMFKYTEANGGNWNILVPPGEENKVMIPPVVASDRGRAQTGVVATHRRGSRTTLWYPDVEQNVLESSVIEGDNPVCEYKWGLVVSWVTRDTSNPARICRAHPARLNTPVRPIAYQYREGKVKSTPIRGVKQYLKPCAYKRSELVYLVTACLLHNEPTSCHDVRG